VSAKEVKERMASLGIQIENMLQFLPQDKVAAFTTMKPTELLTNTMRAVRATHLAQRTRNATHNAMHTLRNAQCNAQCDATQREATRKQRLRSRVRHRRSAGRRGRSTRRPRWQACAGHASNQ
jgi:chromosome segregation ATPase